ncbi:hypothetical protein Tco_1240807, partial [Tanacetum coccineum]
METIKTDASAGKILDIVSDDQP